MSQSTKAAGMGRWLKSWLGIDPRSLAAFRVGIAAVVVVDLLERTRSFTASYSDLGPVPRALVDRIESPAWLFRCFFLSGEPGVQGALFVVTGVCAVAMAVGYRTTIATFATWVLELSLQLRNPWAVDGGDVLLRHLLLFGIFADLGAYWSVDSRRRPVRRSLSEPVFNAGTVGLLTQIVVMYLTTAVLKSGKEWRWDGTAAFFALHQRYFARPLAYVWLDHPLALQWLSWAIMVWEFVGTVLLASPVWIAPLRIVGVVGFVLLDLGLGTSLRVGIHPLVGMAASFAFVPAVAWRPGPTDSVDVASAPSKPGWSRVGRALGSVLASVITIYVVLHNLGAMGVRVGVPAVVKTAAARLGIEQAWTMYAPHPATVDFWYPRAGRLGSGAWIDLDGEAPGRSFQSVQRAHEQYRFRRYVALIQFGRFDEAELYGQWLCRTWNADAPPDRRLTEVALFRAEQDTHPDGPSSQPRAQRIVHETCDAS